MKSQKFKINEGININGKMFNINAEGSVIKYPGSYIDPVEIYVDYDYLKINGSDISMLENELFNIITSSIDPTIISIVENQYPSFQLT